MLLKISRNTKNYNREWDYLRKRELNFVHLNEYFENSHAHHISWNTVIYVPKEYHQAVRHNLETGKKMVLINALAWDYLIETSIEKIVN